MGQRTHGSESYSVKSSYSTCPDHAHRPYEIENDCHLKRGVTPESSTTSSPGSLLLPSCTHRNCINAKVPRPCSRVGLRMSCGLPGGAGAISRSVSMVEWHKKVWRRLYT